MERMDVYSMVDIYKEADKYCKELNENGEVEFIQIGILEDGGIIILVHYKVDKIDYCGTLRLERPISD